ncbi:MAG: hypothetical protein N2560_05115 [Ignavibacteria bacterium]|nr:hypothetical protein [Ignavibacteria bacterium]
MKRLIFVFLGIAFYLLIHFSLVSYENTKAHTTLNKVFVEWLEDLLKNSNIEENGFQLKLSDNLNKMNGPGVTNLGFFESTTGESDLSLTPAEWIAHGGMSADEPEVPAAVRHFYDPVGLNSGKKYLSNRGTYWEGFYSNPGIDAIEWALGDTPKGSANKWSLEKGKEYIVQAIQEKDDNKKRQLLAKAWRCFGEVLHNLADMACPPHVRNDSHAAPLGLSWGWAFGSPDPYEEMFKTSWAKEYANGEPDPNLKAQLSTFKTIREVHEALAKFTNSNFFTGETISGKQGTNVIKPLNGEKAYSSPKLENLDYDSKEFTYYKTFPSGRKIKMCKDDGYFSSLFGNRGYPYIDLECVKSQASELIPNFIWCALKDFALFMPTLSVYISNIDYSRGEIKGEVFSVETDEYKNKINYSGPVYIVIDNSNIKVECIDGKFELSVDKSKVENAKKIQAFVNFWGITYWSPTETKSDYSHLKQFFINLVFEMFEEGTSNTSSFNFDFTSKNSIVWQGNKFNYNLKETTSNTETDKTLYVEMDPFNKNYVNKIIYKHKIIYPQTEGGYDVTDTEEFEIELTQKDKIMWYSDILQWIHLDKDDIRKLLTKVQLVSKIKWLERDDKYNIIGVKTETHTYKQIDFSKDAGLVLYLTK